MKEDDPAQEYKDAYDRLVKAANNVSLGLAAHEAIRAVGYYSGFGAAAPFYTDSGRRTP